MKWKIKNKALALLILSYGFTQPVYADGLADLKQALERLQGRGPISAVLEATIIDNRGKGEDKVERNGQVAVDLEDGESGFKITFSHHVLNQVDVEANEKIKDEEANTPTLNAVNRIDAAELKTILSSASSLLRRLELARFIDEQAVVYDGRAVRVLNFDMPIETLVRDKRTREYVDNFKGNFQVIIDDDGTPIETQLDFKGDGRAYIVLTAKASGSGVSKFKVIDQRLVTMHQEMTTKFESTFGEREMTETMQLVL